MSRELSERTGITQADISRIENGTRNPSLDMLKRLAQGMGMRLRLEFISEQDSEIFNNRGLGKQRDFGK